MAHEVGDWVICTVPAKIVHIRTYLEEDPETTYRLQFADTHESVDMTCIESELIPETDYLKYRVQMLDKKGKVFSPLHLIGTDVDWKGLKSKITGYVLEDGELRVLLQHPVGHGKSSLPCDTPLKLWDNKAELQKQLEAELAALDEQQEAIAVKQDKIREIQAELAALQGK